jgi:uncharacterized protein (TIGR02246 family)
MANADEDAIREIELQFNDAWGRHDADGMVESLADDAQFVTVNGAWTKTRAEYLELMGRLHGANGPFRSSTRETPTMYVNFLAPDVAIMHSEFHYGVVRKVLQQYKGREVNTSGDGLLATFDGPARACSLCRGY